MSSCSVRLSRLHRYSWSRLDHDHGHWDARTHHSMPFDYVSNICFLRKLAWIHWDPTLILATIPIFCVSYRRIPIDLWYSLLTNRIVIDKWFIYVFPCGNLVLIRKISTGIGLNHEIWLNYFIWCTNSKKITPKQNFFAQLFNGIMSCYLLKNQFNLEI